MLSSLISSIYIIKKLLHNTPLGRHRELPLLFYCIPDFNSNLDL